MWHPRNQVPEYLHQVPEKIDADEMGVFCDPLQRRWEQRGRRRVLQNTEVQHKQELQCFGLLCVHGEVSIRSERWEAVTTYV